MGGACSVYVEEERLIRDLVGKYEGKKPLGRPGHRWDDKIMDIYEVGCRGMDCIKLAQDRDS